MHPSANYSRSMRWNTYTFSCHEIKAGVCIMCPDRIKSTGYVVDALEAAVWSLATTGSFEEALLKAVNLGDDTDTVGAIAGGLAGLYYGYDKIPADWLAAIKRRDWIEELCDMA